MKTPCQTVDTGVLKGKVIWKIKVGVHTVILTTDNTLISFGFGDQGALGDGKLVSSNVPVLVPTGTLLNGKQVRDLETRHTGTIVATTDGQMFGWGANIWGELCLPPGVVSRPTLLPTFTKKFKKVFYQIITSIFVTEDNEFYGCGFFPGSYTYSNYQKLDISAINQTVDPIEEVAKVMGSCYYRTKSGNVYQAITGGKPVLIQYFIDKGIQVTKICTGASHLLALSSNGTLYQRSGFRYIRYVDQLNNVAFGDQPTNPFKIVGNDIEKHKIVDIICNGATNLAISDTGEVFGWGRSILFGNSGTYTLIPTKLTLP